MMRFCRFELRTTDVKAAQAFYAAVLNHDGADVVPLPQEARAGGAPPHWLGHIGVDDVERAAEEFGERGATRLGPTRRTADGGARALMRDPGGAVVALVNPPSTPVRADVVWHLLHTTDLTRVLASYRDLFGWQFAGCRDMGRFGVYHPFAWHSGGAEVGSMTDIRDRPVVHPHWLFHFGVATLDVALNTVRAEGGDVLVTTVLPEGDRIAVCHDPQGAAFALRAGRCGDDPLGTSFLNGP